MAAKKPVGTITRPPPGTCDHPYTLIRVDGENIECMRCLKTWRGAAAVPILGHALIQMRESMLDRLERIGAAFDHMGLDPCRSCGRWYRRDTAEGIDALGNGESCFCTYCVADWYAEERDAVNVGQGSYDTLETARPRLATWLLDHGEEIQKQKRGAWRLTRSDVILHWMDHIREERKGGEAKTAKKR